MEKVISSVKIVLNDLLNVAYPNNCKLCRKSLFEYESTICNQCLSGLPETNYFSVAENPIVQLFWGRCEIEHAAALYFVNKNNKVHDLIHLLKYKDKPSIGERIGKLMGAKLKHENSLFKNIDLIVPVPLHWKKEKLRGYNQSYHLALGISEASTIPIVADNLIRSVSNISQTKKGKFERWDNVEDIFTIKDKTIFKDKHILLIDDVVTTGATLEACVHAIKKADCNVSVFTIATAGS